MNLKNTNVIVVKVGTSTLTHENGKMNLRLVELLCRVLSDLQNSGKKIVLVSSGAVGVGMGKIGLETRPRGTAKKQALAAIGQCELMFIYDKFFGEYNQNVAQVLLTADVVSEAERSHNVINTFNELLDMNIIPIVNENDTVAVDELNFGDNDTLSAIVATLVGADALMILTDIDGVYDSNPKTNPNAKRIPVIRGINEEIRAMAGGAGSNRGTGGMATKIRAAEIAAEKHIPTYILAGDDPENLYRVFDGQDIGTVFEV
ncbi:MAG: glutamate 5-kinase [Clostridia bacterium]|nr:glutamate 5-kinase [Clostridia bacterium]